MAFDKPHGVAYPKPFSPPPCQGYQASLKYAGLGSDWRRDNSAGLAAGGPASACSTWNAIVEASGTHSIKDGTVLRKAQRRHQYWIRRLRFSGLCAPCQLLLSRALKCTFTCLD